MIRFLLTLLFLYLLYRLLSRLILGPPRRAFFFTSRGPQRAGPRPAPQAPPAEREVKVLTACAVCQTYVAKAEMIDYGGKHYCSETCRQKEPL